MGPRPMTVLYPEHGGLRERAPAIDDRRLPAQGPRVPDRRDVPVPLAGCGARGRARHGGLARRDVHRRRGWIGLTLSHGAVNGLAAVAAAVIRSRAAAVLWFLSEPAVEDLMWWWSWRRPLNLEVHGGVELLLRMQAA